MAQTCKSCGTTGAVSNARSLVVVCVVCSGLFASEVKSGSSAF